MYYAHFGLNYPPFKITPDPQLFYAGGKRGLVLEALIYAVSSGEGIVKVVGEVGSGKTMLCRMLEEKLPKHIEIVYLINPHLSPDTILHAIAFEMRLSVTPQSSQLEVMHALQTKLLEKHAANQQIVVFIEEAQEMPLETLEEVRLLSNLETARDKLLQIVLFGQPELDTHLAVNHMRQLRERITHSFYLSALTRKEIEEYLDFRMRIVGYRGPPLFSKNAVRFLTQISKGLVRRVNILADKSLLAAFAAGNHSIERKHVQLAARDSGFIAQKNFSWKFASALIVGMSILFLALYLHSTHFFKEFASEKTVVITTPLFPQSTTTANSKAEFEEIAEITSEAKNKSILEQRIQVTRRWLATAEGNHYTIQLLQTVDDKIDELAKLLDRKEIQPLLEQLYIYPAHIKGQIRWRLVYQEFANEVIAVQAMNNLPDRLRRYQPFLRTIDSLRETAAESLE